MKLRIELSLVVFLNTIFLVKKVALQTMLNCFYEEFRGFEVKQTTAVAGTPSKSEEKLLVVTYFWEVAVCAKSENGCLWVKLTMRGLLGENE